MFCLGWHMFNTLGLYAITFLPITSILTPLY
jgi:hypothetical protein